MTTLLILVQNIQVIFWSSMFNTLYFTGLINCIYCYKKNLLSFMIAAEVMFLGLDLGFLGVSILICHPLGIIYSFLILILTVGESAVGLGLSTLALKLENNINFKSFIRLKM